MVTNLIKKLPIYKKFFLIKKQKKKYKLISAPWLKREASIGKFCLEKWHYHSIQEISKEWEEIFNSLPDSYSRKQMAEILRTF